MVKIILLIYLRMEKSLIFEDKFNYGWPKQKVSVKKEVQNGARQYNLSIFILIKSICLASLFLIL